MKHLGTKILETSRLILRPFTIEDADAMFANWAKDPEVTQFLTWPAHENVKVTEHLLEIWEKESENKGNYNWAIELKKMEQPIGSIGVVHINEDIDEMELGYCVGRDFWNQGYASEAVEEVMRFLFEEVGANRICARHDVKNPNSGKVMEHCGMKYEGTLLAAGKNISGVCDVKLYAKVLKSASEISFIQNADAEAQEAEEAAVGIGQRKRDENGRNIISDETIEYVGILAKLELNDEEKEQAKKDMGEMLDYIDKLEELDTEGVEPMSHVFPVNNVFREDIVTNGDGSADALANAPVSKDGGFKVPKTIGE